MQNSPTPQILRCFALAAAVAASVHTASAQVTVYSDDFDVDNTANWVVNVTGAGFSFADFYFDYSTVGIPSAPNSTGGTTRGLKLAANLGSAGIFPAGISVSPLNFGITANFELRFDMWMNYIKSGQGSTEVGGAGYGTAGTTAQVAGVADSVFIGASTDGGTTADYRVYGPGVAISYQDADHIIRTDPTSPLVYAAGTRNNTGSTYYTTNFLAQQVPEAQTNLFPRQTDTVAPAGSISFKWHDVKLRKVGKSITYFIDDVLIATIDSVDATTITNATGGTPAPLGGTNIHFNLYDINGGGSTDIDSTNLLFALYDNVRITDFTNVVTVEATTPTTKEGSGAPAVFTLIRSAPGDPLTIHYTMSGTASNGGDYTLLSGSVTFDASATSTNIYVEAIDDALSELTETVVFNITPNAGYVSGGSATVTIEDNDPNVLQLSSIGSQMYERNNDYCSMRISRLGDLQAEAYPVNFAFTGSADNTDFFLPAPVVMAPGITSTNFILSPIEDAVYENTETVICSIAAATAVEYTIGSPNTVTNTIVNATLPPESLLFSDDFDIDSTTAWTIYATETNGPTADYSLAFAYDYGGLGIPPSPHGGGSTLGLLMTVNKSDLNAAAAALNVYPIGQSFSGNFALRFDMYLSSVPGTQIATEHALCGINHSGNMTNWFRNGPGGISTATWGFDGIFCGIGADASGSAPGDYGFFSSPTNSSATATNLATAAATKFSTNEFKQPPYSVAGAPANNPSATVLTPIWTDVEISKIGNVITLWINNTKILIYTNTTPYTSGNIMLGYDDAYDSIGAVTSYVVYDNVRVVSVSPPMISVQPVGSTNAPGTSMTFSVTASTSTSITNYQWFRNGVPIAGATGDTYTIASVTAAHYGSYRVDVNDGHDTTSSDAAALVSPAPVINVQPASRAAVVGSSPSFTVTATTFNGTTNYQWMYYGTNIAGAGVGGATARTLTLTNVQPVRFGGPYTVRVNDGVTSVTSAPPAFLTMAVSPSIGEPVLVGAGLAFNFGTEFGPSYVVDFKSALTNAAWTPIRTNAGTGSPIIVTNQLTGSQGFFRIRLQ
jgi:hypothetical protein